MPDSQQDQHFWIPINPEDHPMTNALAELQKYEMATVTAALDSFRFLAAVSLICTPSRTGEPYRSIDTSSPHELMTSGELSPTSPTRTWVRARVEE